MFGVISQTLANILCCGKRENPGITGSQGKICLVREKGKEKKNKKTVQDMGSLAWHLYLMDLIKKKEKRENEQAECRETKSVH